MNPVPVFWFIVIALVATTLVVLVFRARPGAR